MAPSSPGRPRSARASGGRRRPAASMSGAVGEDLGRRPGGAHPPVGEQHRVRRRTRRRAACRASRRARSSPRRSAPRSRPSSSSARARSCPNVGSSRARIGAPAMSAVPTESRRFWPPERRKGCVSALSASPKRSSIARTRRSTSASGRVPQPQAVRQLVEDRVGDELVLRVLEHEPDPRRQLARRRRAGVEVRRRARVPRGGGTTPAIACTRVVLPAPLAPMTATKEPPAMSRSMSCSTGCRPARDGEAADGDERGGCRRRVARGFRRRAPDQDGCRGIA